MTRLDEIEARARRGHEMSCSDPSDPDRTTRYSDTLALVEFTRQVKASVTSSWRAHDPNFDIIRDLLNDLEQP